jgi:hypothetical protein
VKKPTRPTRPSLVKKPTRPNRPTVNKAVAKLLGRFEGALLRQALKALAAGRHMSRDQVACVADCLDDPDCGLTDDECDSIRYGLEVCGGDGSDEDDDGDQDS